MIVIPAIDIKDGNCVRLYQGRREMESIYSNDPAEVALRWQKEGAQYLHLVDLDGAFSGVPQNLTVLERILEKVNIPVEFGGGLRDIETIRQVFKMGVDRVVLGTAVIRDRGFLRAAMREFGRQVFVGIDVRDGRLTIEGWESDVEIGPAELLSELQEIGLGGVIYTDVLTDGTLSGPNIRALDELLRNSRYRVIASGGVASIEHLRQLKKLQGGKLYGVIIGRALYSGDIDLSDALEAVADNNRKER